MKRIAVLRGGPSEEYSVSMKTGEGVLGALKELNYPVKDIIITKKGEWLDSGFAKGPSLALEGVDVVFLGLHGQYGEDGQVQRILEHKGIPFTGSRALSSAIAFNKELTKHTLRPHGIKMPRHRRFTRTDLDRIVEQIPTIFSDIGSELFVKPVANGSSYGAKKVRSEEMLYETLMDLMSKYDSVLIEEFIRGKEATVAVLDNFRNEKTYVLPVVEIIPPNGEDVFSTEAKYNGKTEEIVPGRFSYREKSELSNIASLAHKVIGCKHYSRSDFIIRDGDIYFLEINTLPGLTAESLFPKAAESIGLQYKDLVKHLIDNALLKN